MKPLLLAIETGGTKIQLVLGTSAGDICYRYRTLVDRKKGMQGILDKVLEAFPLLEQEAAKLGGKIECAGIGFGGPVDSTSGMAIWSAQIDGWGNFPVADYFKEKTGLSAYLFNDSNAAAWGEYCRGAGRGSQIFFYTNIGSGIGGGIILNGKLFDGQGFGAAEFGQSYLYDPWYKGDSRYPVNHIERICSGWSIEQRLRSDKIPENSVLLQLCEGHQEKINCHLWSEAIRMNDGYALKVLEETAEYFAIALSNVLCFYSPEVIAIGGGVSLIGDPLITRIRKYTDQYVYQNSRGKYRIVKSELDEDVVLVGTLLLTGERYQKEGQ